MKTQRTTVAWVRHVIPRRPSDSHKGKNGHVLLVAGSRNMTGAALLSALGALKSGVGLLTVALPASSRKTLLCKIPEAMTILPAGIPSFVRRRQPTTLAAGPGLGVGPRQRQLILKILRFGLPMVLDADGLNNVRPSLLAGKPLVITPHPGELAKLLGVSTKQVQQDRSRIATLTAKRLHIVCVLKGEETVISDGQRTLTNPTGNPAMATGGMGDVLTGVIAGLLAQGLSLFDAACAGVYLHGLAADLMRVSDRGLLASDVAGAIPKALRKIGLR